MSQIAKGENNYRKSFEYLFQALDIIPNGKEPEQKVSFYHSSSNTFMRLGLLDEALKYSNIALEISKNNKLDVSTCYLQAQIIEIENKLGSEDKTNRINQTISDCKEHQISLLLANLYRSLGNNYLSNSSIDEALLALQQSQLFLDKNPYQPERMELLFSLAKASYLKDNPSDAEKYLQLIVNSEINDWSNINFEVYELLSKVKESQGLQDEANQLMQNAYISKIQAYEERNKLSVAYQQVKYVNLESEATIKILDQENELLKLNSEVQTQSKRIYQLLSLVAGLLVALITALFLRTKRLKERYQELSRKDGLTGVLSRRYVLNIAKGVHDKSMASNQKYSLVVFDLDYFKSINDKYGHAVGDWVLKQVTEKVSNEIREGDAFGRLGGEEFVLVLPNTKSDNAKKLAERCLDAIKTIHHEVFEDGFIVTASFGVATYPEFNDLEALIQNADDAMYKAKQMGRNQIFSFAQ